MKNKEYKKYAWMFPPILVCMSMLIIYAIKGVYPFGTGTIIDYDLYQGGVPMAFSVYDAIHTGNFFYNFQTACGLSSDALFAFLAPTNLFLSFSPREMLIDAFSVLLIFKFMCIAGIASYVFLKIFNDISVPWNCILSLMYTFCGYNLLYYTNLEWLDMVALYPLLMYFTRSVFQGKKQVGYFIVLTYLLIFQTYMAFFAVLSILVFGGFYICILISKDARKKSIFSLGVCTLSSLLAGGYSVFRFLKNAFQTARFTSIYQAPTDTVSTVTTPNMIDKFGSMGKADIVTIFMFLGTGLAISAFVWLLVASVKHKEHKPYAIYFSLVLFLLLLQVVFHGVNVMWHGGSFVMFPFRNGYMVGFFACCVVGYYVQKIYPKQALLMQSKNLIFQVLACIPFFVLLLFYFSHIQLFHNALNIFSVLESGYLQTGSLLYPFFSFAFVVVLLYFSVQLFSNRKAQSFVLACCMLITILGNAYAFIGRGANSKETNLYHEIYDNCFDVKEHVQSKNGLDRICNPDLSLMTNYAYLSQTNSISNWTHTLSEPQLQSFFNLGFTRQYTRVTDGGGTAFSKALLGINQSVSYQALDETQYTYVEQSSRGLRYYQNKYTLPIGLCFQERIKDISQKDYQNSFAYQNAVFDCLLSGESLFVPIEKEEIQSELIAKERLKEKYTSEDGNISLPPIHAEESLIKFKSRIPKNSILYVQRTDEKCSLSDIKVNGKALSVAREYGYKDKKINTTFPAQYNQNLLELGCYADEMVEVELTIQNGNADSFVLYALCPESLDTLKQQYPNNTVCTQKDVVTIHTTAVEENNVVLIPLQYDENWKCHVNGEERETSKILGSFIGVDVPEGDCEIQLQYQHKQQYLAYLLIVIFFGLGFIALYGFRKINNIPKCLNLITSVCFGIAFIGILCVLYLFPIGCTVAKLFI